MLSPHKKVLLPDLKAGCSLADSCPPPVFRKFKEKMNYNHKYSNGKWGEQGG